MAPKVSIHQQVADANDAIMRAVNNLEQHLLDHFEAGFEAGYEISSGGNPCHSQ